jgi:hypothetical protein
MSNPKYVESKIDNNWYCMSNGQFTKHLKNNNLNYQQYYEKYITGILRTCFCGHPLRFYQNTHKYAKSCGNPVCIGNLVSDTKKSWTQEQKQQDSDNKRIAAASKTLEQIHAQVTKSKETFRKKYGFEWATQSTDYKTKSKATKLARHGNEHFNGNKKTSQSWQSKSDNEISDIVNKRRATCLERFGVENALMKPISRINSARANRNGREYTLPSGRVLRVRGHEDAAITILLKTYAETELLFDDRKIHYSLPVFTYTNVNLHNALYYPDIYIESKNKLIEVKSPWWWDGKGATRYKSRLENNLRKKDAVLAAGYQYEVWLFTDKNTYEILSWK